MADTGSISVWLSVIAIALVVQVLMLVAVAVAAFVVYRRVTSALHLVQRDQVGPMVTRVNTALDDVHEVLGRMKSADENVRHALARTGAGVGHAASSVKSGLGPVIGLGRGVWAALASFRRRQPLPGAGAEGNEADFAYQGGRSHVRS